MSSQSAFFAITLTATKPVIATFAPITPADLVKLYKKHDLDDCRIKTNTGYQSGPTTLTLQEFPKEDEQYIAGLVMRECGKEFGRAFSLDNLLVMVEEENAKSDTVIPKEYRNQCYFPADGTVLLNEDGDECFACADWDSSDHGRWSVYVFRPEDVWLSDGRLLRPLSK